MDSGNELEVQDYLGDAEFALDDTSARKSVKKGFFKKNRIWLVPVIVILLALGGFFGYQKFFKKDTSPKITYQYETVKQGTLTNTISGTGNIAVRHEIDVNASTSGKVKSVKVSVGDEVDKGQTLFTLDDTDVEATIKSASASVISAEQQVANARSNLTSAKAKLISLRSQRSSSGTAASATTVTTNDIIAAKQAITAAQLGLSAAGAQLSSAQSDYGDAVDARSDLKVKAPCAGTIWTVSVSKGDTVSTGSSSSGNSGSSSSTGGASAGSTSSSTTSSSSSTSSASMTIAKNSVLGVKLAINETDVTSIKDGQTASVTFDAIDNETFTGKVDEVAHEGSTSSNVVSYDVWVVLDKSDSRFKSGMTAAAEVTVSKESDVLLVSNAAVKGSGSNQYVLIMKTGATAPSQTKVTIGTRGDSQTVIKSGVTAGERIVSQAITTSSTGTTSSILGNMAGASSRSASGGMPGGGGGTPPSGMQGGN